MKIGIVGAGYAGLSAALDLANAGHQVTVYEANAYVGGLAAGFKEPHWDWSVEHFYHHWFQSDAHMLGIIEELGLTANVRFPRPLTVMEHNGKWYPFDSIINALLFPGLGWGINKIRFGFVGLFLRISKNWRMLEKTTVDAWMRKWAGNKVYESMWKPLIDGKFGPYAQDVNMAWMWARMHARTTRLGTYVGGFQQFADDFAAILKDKGVEIKLNNPVNTLAPDADGVAINGTRYDKVLTTTSPGLLAKMAPTLPQDYLQGLLDLKSMGALVMTFALNDSVSKEGYYWFNMPKASGYPFLAMVEHTNYVSKDNFGGDHILYCGDYLPVDHDYFDLSKDELETLYIEGIQRINPDFNKSWIKKSWLFSASYAQPVPLVNHSQNIPSIQTPIPGLYFASMSQVYPWDRGTNFAVEIGRRAAKMMR